MPQRAVVRIKPMHAKCLAQCLYIASGQSMLVTIYLFVSFFGWIVCDGKWGAAMVKSHFIYIMWSLTALKSKETADEQALVQHCRPILQSGLPANLHSVLHSPPRSQSGNLSATPNTPISLPLNEQFLLILVLGTECPTPFLSIPVSQAFDIFSWAVFKNCDKIYMI